MQICEERVNNEAFVVDHHCHIRIVALLLIIIIDADAAVDAVGSNK